MTIAMPMLPSALEGPRRAGRWLAISAALAVLDVAAHVRERVDGRRPD